MNYRFINKILSLFFILLLILISIIPSISGLNENNINKSILNYKQSNSVLNDTDLALGCIYEPVIKINESPLQNYPSYWNWKDHGVLTGIRNQGGCGSCVAFGVLGAFESVISINTGSKFDLSEADLFFCGGGDCNNGWYISSAVNYLYNSGVPDENCFPYYDYNMDCDTCDDRLNRIKKPTEYGYLSSESSIKSAIYNIGPIITSFGVYEDFHNSYSSGIYKYEYGGLNGYHCVTVVGYNDEEEYWICKNSWGSNWGEEGFFRIGYGEPNVFGNQNDAICRSAYFLKYNGEGGTLTVDAGGPYSGRIGETINFYGNARGGVTPYTWNWDFGDGKTSNLQNPTHIYNEAGKYSVNLEVIDNELNYMQDVSTVEIFNSPYEPVKPSGPNYGFPNTTYYYETFANDPNNANIRYAWDWNGDNIIDEWTDYFPPRTVINKSHIFTSPGTYYVQVLAKNILGVKSEFSNSLKVYISDENQKPNQPNNPYPEDNAINISLNIELSWDCSDPDPNDNLTFDIYFGTNSTPILIFENYSSNTYYPIELRPGTIYFWKIIARDLFNNHSESKIWKFTTEGNPNYPPSIPIIKGPNSGKTSSTYGYNFLSNDPDNDRIYYFIDWGDNTTTDWIGPFDSNKEIFLTHSWENQGTYIIKAKVRDNYYESDWGIIEISMPKTLNKYFLMMEYINQNYPNLYKIFTIFKNY